MTPDRVATWTRPDGTIAQWTTITDILGEEDHFGDMDFKLAGTTKGITGFQLDLKINGLPFEIAKTAIFQARDARIEILKVMLGSLPAPRASALTAAAATSFCTFTARRSERPMPAERSSRSPWW